MTDTRALTTIGFDADDTLWHNETHFRMTQKRFAEMLADFAEGDHLEDRLLAAERRNLGHYGYGVKGFVLSMIETAIEVTEGRVSSNVISALIASGREMLRHPVELLPYAADVVAALRKDFRIIVITKGDLLDQERKLAQSGLGDLFHGIEIVSDKTASVYANLFHRHGDGAAWGMMIGNSLKSDVLPMLAAGGYGVYVPHGVTWAMEIADAPDGHDRFHALADLQTLPDLVATLASTHNI